jgi:hypothetical protein
MRRVIIYQSHQGHTKKYAQSLAEKLNIQIYPVKEAKGIKNCEIIYFGNIFCGQIEGAKSIAKNNKVIILVGVGLTKPSENYLHDLDVNNNIDNAKIYYLQGGIKPDELKGIRKLIINTMAKNLLKNNPEDEMGLALVNGIELVDLEGLKEIISWYNLNYS